jgi:hypothetical protein
MASFARVLGDFGFRFLERTHLDQVSFRGVQLQTLLQKHDREAGHGGERYRLTPLRSSLHRAVGALPTILREKAAERFLRRAGSPGPAAEHVFQYLLSAEMAKEKGGARHPEEATVAKGADHFYQRQYRQYFNSTMGAFAVTAKMAFVCSGDAPRGWLWGRRRRVHAAMLEEIAGAPPIIVIDRQTVALPLLLPEPATEAAEVEAWLAGRKPMPGFYRAIAAGEEVRCAERRARARRRGADGALIELTDAVLQSGKLAILALHPHDPDAMGLHITLFGTQALEADRVEEEYGFRAEVLDPWRHAASERGRRLRFLVGGVEELFTQCSQNLFVKRPAADPDAPRRAAAWPNAWEPGLGLERLLNAQFEILQATVSASGLPGASPRNGDIGKAAYVGRRGTRTFVLIPYFPGNAVHGHAAKLWSNPYGELVIWDDHGALSAITISGPSWTVAHRTVEKDFPAIAANVAARQKRNGAAAARPEYWFLQEVAEIVQQVEPLAANSLDPSRSTCAISAGGLARHGKKPAYFAADTLPPYDPALQHEREAAGRPIDPTGYDGYIFWAFEMAPALEARRAHLDQLRA